MGGIQTGMLFPGVLSCETSNVCLHVLVLSDITLYSRLIICKGSLASIFISTSSDCKAQLDIILALTLSTEDSIWCHAAQPSLQAHCRLRWTPKRIFEHNLDIPAFFIICHAV